MVASKIAGTSRFATSSRVARQSDLKRSLSITDICWYQIQALATSAENLWGNQG